MRNYQIIILGPRSSGKTLLLASMYYQLSVPEKYNIYLLCDNTSTLTNPTDGTQMTPHKLLIERYTKLGDYSADWEPGTVDVEQWQFTCKVQRPDVDFETYTACRFTYLDYAGGDFDIDGHNDELETKLKGADSLLGLLDGEKILSMMQGKDGGLREINRDLANMMHYIMGQRHPVHFVISKWDLLEGMFSLESVRKRLLKVEPLRKFVKLRGEGNSIVRLIPVSAVGLNFAKLENGIMIKIPEANLKPFLVEMPLACVLPDKIQSELEQIQQRKQEIEEQEIDSTPRQNIKDLLFDIIGRGIDWFNENIVPELPPSLRVSSDILEMISEAAQARARQSRKEQESRIREFATKRAESLKAVENEETALNYALKVFVEMQTRLDYHFPASILDLPNSTESLEDLSI
jgi:GTPase SAR1 family protein